MPELPEVETIVRDLAKSIVGVQVTQVWGSGLPLRLARPVDLIAIQAVARGRRITGVRRRAKYLLIDFEPQGRGKGSQKPVVTGPGILVHLGMSGRLLVEPARQPRPLHTHLAFALADGRELRFRDPRRFGFVAAGAPVDARPELQSLGPDPLTEMKVDDLVARMNGVRAPIKSFLLDQTRIAGLGNIYVCEALHGAGIHPSTQAGRLRRRAGLLLDNIQSALESGIKNRGTTLRDYVDSSGVVGTNAQSLRVYGREGKPCFTCGTAIGRCVDGGRSTFLCPRCQRR